MSKYYEIEFSGHGKRRSGHRSFDEQEIREVIDRPTQRRPGGENKIIAERKISKRKNLRVVYTEYTYTDDITGEVIDVVKVVSVSRPKRL